MSVSNAAYLKIVFWAFDYFRPSSVLNFKIPIGVDWVSQFKYFVCRDIVQPNMTGNCLVNCLLCISPSECVFLVQQNNCRLIVSAGCPPGFTYLPVTGSCYKILYEQSNWTSASEKCHYLRSGSDLVAIASAAENTALQTFLASELSSAYEHCC